MIPFPNFLPPVGTASAATDLANQLGNVFLAPDGKQYRLVKAGAAISAAGTLVVSTALSSNIPTWAVDLAGKTGYSVSTAAGVVPKGQTGSTGTTGLVSGDYFLVQVSGLAYTTSGGTLAQFDSVGATGSAGKVDTSTTDSVVIGTALKAATDTSTEVPVLLRGLV
jgi:hypothetical protein